MNMTLPPEAEIQRHLPQIQSIVLIDTGGFKAVYQVSIAGRDEALKLIQIPASDGTTDAEAFKQEMIGRVRREVEALGRCKIPEIVKLGNLPLTPLSINGVDYVAYSEEFLAGSDLWKILTTPGTQKPLESELRLLFVALLKAIQEVWSLGYVHRDIKPKNVMKLTTAARQFVLLDFGIAYSVQETGLTAHPDQRVVATYRYLAPEMMNPTFRETIDYRTDLYTAAMTVYEYGAHCHPLAQNRDDMMRTISRALRQPATPLTTHRPDLSLSFCQIIDQMLKKKPALRPANLNALIQRMESGS